MQAVVDAVVGQQQVLHPHLQPHGILPGHVLLVLDRPHHREWPYCSVETSLPANQSVAFFFELKDDRETIQIQQPNDG